MELHKAFRNEDWTQPFYAFVFDRRDEATGFHSMFFMSEDGVSLHTWRLGRYDPDGPNEHLGTEVDWHTLRPETLDRFMAWIAINGASGRTVVVKVSGGVADVTQKPDDVEVEIIDHDNEA